MDAVHPNGEQTQAGQVLFEILLTSSFLLKTIEIHFQMMYNKFSTLGVDIQRGFHEKSHSKRIFLLAIFALVAFSTATDSHATTGNIQIISNIANGSGLSGSDEYVVSNMDTKLIQLQNWTLRDAANHIYTFPSHSMNSGQECRIYTNQSHPDTCGFNYNSSSAIWNNSGDTAYLRNSSNNIIDEFTY